MDSSEAACTLNSSTSGFVVTSSPVSTGGITYDHQLVECYCLSSDCTIDVDNDDISDCLTSSGLFCDPVDANSDG